MSGLQNRCSFPCYLCFANILWKVAGRVVCKGLEIVRNCSVKSTTLPKLRRTHADAASVAQLIDFVEQIHDIEPDFDRLLST